MLTDANDNRSTRTTRGMASVTCIAKPCGRKTPFPEQDFNEDWGMVSAALAQGCKLDHFADTWGLCLHVMRGDNASICYPQYTLPDFMLARMFPPEVAEHLRAE